MRKAAGWVVCCALLLPPALAPSQTSAPPEFPVPRSSMPESGVDGLPASDPRRHELFLDLALLRHREAEELERLERRAHADAVACWRDAQRVGQAGLSSPAPPLATPRADTQRSEAVRLAQRALDERPESPVAPLALLVAGIDAERIGRRKEAARMLRMLPPP